jgi:hypothetical protein
MAEEQKKRGRGRPRKNPEAVAPSKPSAKDKTKKPLSGLDILNQAEELPKKKGSSAKRKSGNTVVVEADEDGTELKSPKGHSIQMRGGKWVKVEDSDSID